MTIDWWTLGLQTINVVVLVWLLGRFFWRPVAAMIEQRRATAQRILTEAEEMRFQSAAALAAIEQTRAGFGQERDSVLTAAHEAAEQARDTLLEEAAREIAARDAAATAAIEKRTLAAEKAWADHAGHLAVSIAERLAARLDGPAVQSAFLDWLLAAIHALPEAARKAVVDSGVELEAISATALTPADQQRCRERIGAAFGAATKIAFKEDATLIAGLELRGPHLRISNSWRADLDRILADVTHGK